MPRKTTVRLPEILRRRKAGVVRNDVAEIGRGKFSGGLAADRLEPGGREERVDLGADPSRKRKADDDDSGRGSRPPGRRFAPADVPGSGVIGAAVLQPRPRSQRPHIKLDAPTR